MFVIVAFSLFQARRCFPDSSKPFYRSALNDTFPKTPFAVLGVRTCPNSPSAARCSENRKLRKIKISDNATGGDGNQVI